MNHQSSSNSPPDLLLKGPQENCQICERPAHGNHYGAITCRACAAFFRRFGLSKKLQPCVSNKKCKIPTSRSNYCKTCRMERCKENGMTTENFQFERDPCFSKDDKRKEHMIPPTMDTFLGRSNLIIHCAKHPDSTSKKQFINVQFLIDKASDVLLKGVETPFTAPNSLEKLALGFQNTYPKSQPRSTRFISKAGREEFFELWQNDLLKAANWLTYFDEFQQLSHNLKLDMLKGIWIIWNRLEKLITIANARRHEIVKCNQTLFNYKDEQVVFEWEKLEIDLSWCSRYTIEELKFFGEPKEDSLDFMVESITALDPTDVELAFMLCQLCLHHVGKRYQGEILEVSERLQDSISNDLHNYYTNRLKVTKYSNRIASMMKINNSIREGMYHRRAHMEFMKIFDVFYVEYSDPEMFLDN